MTTTIKSLRLADDYLKLVNRFPLIRIRDDRHLKAAHAIIDELSVIDEEKLTPGQLDYLLALGDLTSVYEQEAFDEMTRGVTGVDLLRHLAEEHSLTASDIGRILGQRELGGKILRGDRNISKSMAKSLGEHFHVGAELFLK